MHPAVFGQFVTILIGRLPNQLVKALLNISQPIVKNSLILACFLPAPPFILDNGGVPILTPYQGPTAFHILMLFTWSHARLLDPAFDPPRQWCHEESSGGSRQKRVFRRYGDLVKGIEIVDIESFDAKGTPLGTTENRYLVYGMPPGRHFHLRYVNNGHEPAALELDVDGPPMETHAVIAAFNRRFAEQGPLTRAELEEARRRMRQSLESGSRGTAWLYGELILEAEPDDREALQVVELSHLPPR